MLTYPVSLERDADGRILVEFPDFPQAHTWGEDRDEALVRARDALATIIDAYIRDRQALPEPSAHVNAPRVRLPALTEAKVQLYRSMRRAHVSKTELARRLGWHLPQVDRLLNVYHGSRLDQLEVAFRALGKELSVSVVDQTRPPSTRAGAATGKVDEPRRRRRRRNYPLAGRPPAKAKQVHK